MLEGVVSEAPHTHLYNSYRCINIDYIKGVSYIFGYYLITSLRYHPVIRSQTGNKGLFEDT